MKKRLLSSILCFGILSFALLINFGLPSKASAAGSCLSDQTGLSEFNGLTSTDLLARLIYAEAYSESLTGKKGVGFVVKNRIAKNLSEFGGNTYSGVILKPGSFAGMTTSLARCPSTTSTAWLDSLSVASNINTATNPVGKTLWFNTNSVYTSRTYQFPTYVGYTFNGGASYSQVVEKYVIGGHTFFRVSGY
ncbi:cell wall hydrolase [Robertmurraya sp. FSL R5-0851]|uniref:cell wall hydrolase n=1 Tax=Robertmurraya sp. FSL R5-0851 TaxID=2921584 RepID=UPI0030F5EDDD